jgi:nitronate monooxygenase
MQITTPLNNLLNISFPLIMAPMFLVSNEGMMKSAIDGGVMGVFPSLNYRNAGELDAVIDEFRSRQFRC